MPFSLALPIPLRFRAPRGQEPRDHRRIVPGLPPHKANPAPLRLEHDLDALALPLVEELVGTGRLAQAHPVRDDERRINVAFLNPELWRSGVPFQPSYKE